MHESEVWNPSRREELSERCLWDVRTEWRVSIESVVLCGEDDGVSCEAVGWIYRGVVDIHNTEVLYGQLKGMRDKTWKMYEIDD